MPDAFIYDNPDVVYMGINKNASTTTLITLGYNQKANGVKEGVLGIPRRRESYDHKKRVSHYRDILPNHFIFTFVRNPYDRIVSYFSWGKFNNPHNFIDFESFVKTRLSKKDFFNGDFKLQTFSIDDPGKCDFIGRFENFADDFDTVMKMLGIKFDGLTMHRNKMKRDEYRKYYTSSEIKDIVTEKFQKDIETFDYTF